MAPDVLLALVSAGAVLWVEDRRLRFRAPALRRRRACS